MSKKSIGKVDELAQPAGVKIVGELKQPLDAASVRLLIEGWDIKRRIDALKARLDAINDSLIDAHGTGCALVATGLCRASLTERETVKIADAGRLMSVLGARFGDLVKTEVVYRPEKRLVEMAADGDDPLAPALRECLTAGSSLSVTWRAEGGA